MFDMQVIVRRQDQEHCASITRMIRHYVARRAQVSEAHPHNAADRAAGFVKDSRPTVYSEWCRQVACADGEGLQGV